MFYRIAAVTMRLPPLRERVGDIPCLVEAFLQEFSRKHEVPAFVLRPDALEYLMSQSWPGNVRQLRHEVEKAAIFADSCEVDADDFRLAHASQFAVGEADATGRSIGGSVDYSQDKLWLSAAADQHKNGNGIDTDRLLVVAGAYDFGVVKPLALYSRSKVAGASYSAYSFALTVPSGDQGSVRAAVSHIIDWNTATVAKEGLTKASLGYVYYLSKRTNINTSVASAKGETATRTTAFDVGLSHSF
jgi:hypothetical protein